jgi:hypothetical protein
VSLPEHIYRFDPATERFGLAGGVALGLRRLGSLQGTLGGKVFILWLT